MSFPHSVLSDPIESEEQLIAALKEEIAALETSIKDLDMFVTEATEPGRDLTWPGRGQQNHYSNFKKSFY